MTRSQHHREPETTGGSGRYWLLLLLIVLVVVLVFYDHGAAKQYGDQAFSVTSKVAHKVVNWTSNLFQCGISGCTQKATSTSADATQLASNNPAQVAPYATAPTMSAQPMTAPEEPAAPVLASPTLEQAPTLVAPPVGEQPGAHIDSPTVPVPTPNAAIAFPPPLPSIQTKAPQPEPVPQPSAAPQVSQPPASSPVPHAPVPAYQPPPAPAVEQRAIPSVQTPVPATPGGSSPPVGMPYSLPFQQQSAQPVLPPASPARPDSTIAQAKSNFPLVPEGIELARNSALAGRLDESIRGYRQYLSAYPNDFDAHGELGNVYYHAGRYQQSAQHYYEAATRLIDVGQIGAASDLLPVIQKHEPRLASLLARKLSQATGGNRSYSR